MALDNHSIDIALRVAMEEPGTKGTDWLINLLPDAKRTYESEKLSYKKRIKDYFFNFEVMIPFWVQPAIITLTSISTFSLLMGIGLSAALIPFLSGIFIETCLFIGSVIKTNNDYIKQKKDFKTAKKNLKAIKKELARRGIKVNKSNEIVEVKNTKETPMESIPIEPKNYQNIDNTISIDSRKNNPKKIQKK